MKLLIVSNMAHYLDTDSQPVSPWQAAVGEIDALASIATEVRHVAFLHPEAPPPGSTPYRASNVRVNLSPAVGGQGLWAKGRVLTATPKWRRILQSELEWADAVQVRSPCNIALFALTLLAARKTPTRRWVKYAGQWQRRQDEPLAYTLQRLALRSGLTRATVGISEPNPPGGPVRYVPNPSFTAEECRDAEARTRDKRLDGPLRMLFAGRLDRRKGPDRAVRILASLVRRGVDASLTIAGAGPEETRIRDTAAATRVASRVSLRGWLDRDGLNAAYAQSHILVLPSDTEGWPKVLSEGLAFRVVPFAGSRGGIPAVLARAGAGAALDPNDIELWAEQIARRVADPNRWSREADRGRLAAEAFTYERYLESARKMLSIRSEPGISRVAWEEGGPA